MNLDEPEKLPTTRGGLLRAQQRLSTAKARYLAVCATNEEAAGSGDSSVWHDNFAYEENQRQMHQLAARIHELNAALSRMVVVQLATSPSEVGVGTEVSLVDQETGTISRLVVGGWDDSDVALRRVAINSPIGRALAGAVLGETRACPSAGAIRELEVVALAAATEEVL